MLFRKKKPKGIACPFCEPKYAKRWEGDPSRIVSHMIVTLNSRGSMHIHHPADKKVMRLIIRRIRRDILGIREIWDLM